jgi:hypothetical protein
LPTANSQEPMANSQQQKGYNALHSCMYIT